MHKNEIDIVSGYSFKIYSYRNFCARISLVLSYASSMHLTVFDSEFSKVGKELLTKYNSSDCV